MNEYVIAFSSFYKAVYAQEKLNENHIRSTLKKLPPELIRSCGYGLYVRTNSVDNINRILSKNKIDTRGVFQV